MEMIFLLFCFTFLLIKFFLTWTTSPVRITNPPPSPPKLPVIGNLHQLGRHPHRSLRSLSIRYGPLMLLRLRRTPVLVVSSAEMARDVMKTHDRSFSSRPRWKMVEKLLSGGRDVIFAPYGEYWRQMKSIFLLHLLSSKMVRSFHNVREEEVSFMMEKIEEASSSSPINLSEYFATVTNNVICRAAMGRKYCGEEGMVIMDELLRKLINVFSRFHIGDYVSYLGCVDRIRGLDDELDRINNEINDFLENMVKEHLNDEEEHSNFLDVLLSIQRKKTVGVQVDNTSVKLLVLDVFVAGTDTTSTLLEWAMTQLLKHPNCMYKLRDEIRTISENKTYISEEVIENMPYLKAVIKETLRLHPPAPLLVPRELIHDVKLKGYDILKGTQVIINAWAIGRETTTWGSDAEEFKPERHLDSHVDFYGHDFQLIPFGAGRRICPGIGFAMVTAELALANLVHRFDWKALVEPLELRNNMAESSGLIVRRSSPLIAYASIV